VAFNREVIAPLPTDRQSAAVVPQEAAPEQDAVPAVLSASEDKAEKTGKPIAEKPATSGNIWDSLLETGDIFAAAVVNPDNFVVASSD